MREKVAGKDQAVRERLAEALQVVVPVLSVLGEGPAGAVPGAMAVPEQEQVIALQGRASRAVLVKEAAVTIQDDILHSVEGDT